MLVLITKASDDYWHEFRNVNTIEEIMSIAKRLVISKNHYYHRNTPKERLFWIWDAHITEEEIPLFNEAKYKIMIYDSWIE